MIATSDNKSSSGTLDCQISEPVSYVTGEFETRKNETETIDQLKKMKIFELDGGVCRWFDSFGEQVYILIYWKIVRLVQIYQQVITLPRMGYWSGFLSTDRGLHWNRYPKIKRY